MAVSQSVIHAAEPRPYQAQAPRSRCLASEWMKFGAGRSRAYQAGAKFRDCESNVENQIYRTDEMSEELKSVNKNGNKRGVFSEPQMPQAGRDNALHFCLANMRTDYATAVARAKFAYPTHVVKCRAAPGAAVFLG